MPVIITGLLFAIQCRIRGERLMWAALYPTAVGVVCQATVIAGLALIKHPRLRQHAGQYEGHAVAPSHTGPEAGAPRLTLYAFTPQAQAVTARAVTYRSAGVSPAPVAPQASTRPALL